MDSQVWWHLLHYAVMAPSGHNTQPWLFRISGGAAELLCDRSRWLPTVDPEGRELVMSCGAALLNLRLAIAHFGYEAEIGVLPEASNEDLLARVRLIGEGAAPEDTSLFDAIAERRTNRFAFAPTPVADPMLEQIEEAARGEGAWVVVVRGAADRRRLAELIAEGDRIQADDPDLRKELAAWVRSNHSPRRDGLRGYSFGHGRFASLLAPLYVRYANWGDSQAEADEVLASSGPVLAVLGTETDDRRSWMAAGQALGRALLVAQAHGVSASFFNQPIEVPELRDRLRAAVAASGYPQLCFRLGFGKPVMPSPRRAIEDVVVGDLD